MKINVGSSSVNPCMGIVTLTQKRTSLRQNVGRFGQTIFIFENSGGRLCKIMGAFV